MIRLIDGPPRDPVLEQLRDWQAEVDAVVEFRDRVATAQRLFKQRNRAHNSTFVEVRGALRAMCGDAQWCCYCERSQAAEIDHVRPKSLYPGAVFSWSNFLWVCGRCNKLKSDRFGMVVGTEIRRALRDRQAQPPAGAPALIDPRIEDPLDFLARSPYFHAGSRPRLDQARTSACVLFDRYPRPQRRRARMHSPSRLPELRA